MEEFGIDFLDHVAIKVADMEATAKWYEEVLGFQRYHVPVWGDFPIMLMAGKSRIAMFPATKPRSETDSRERVRIDHFAFNITNENFLKAQKRFQELGISFEFQDHYYFHSIYLNDPDGHRVELTTLVRSDGEFFPMRE